MLPRYDAREKVTGAAQFGTDLHLPEMAHTKLWRSPLPHARITAIDVTAAEHAPGVICVSLFEEMIYQDGQLLNAGLLQYPVPSFDEIPASLRTLLIENADGTGPFGAKGIGEGGLIPTAPALAAAIWQASGVRLHELPMTPERICHALRQKA